MKMLDFILVGIVSGIMSVAAAFPDDASTISWAHAVNSKKKLEDALADKVQFLEADVSLGNVTGPNPEIMVPIMAHPPDETSDISLSNWIQKVITANRNKGVKLDFKFLEIVEPSLKILKDHKDKITFPLWLNADILPGPVDSTTVSVNSTQFLLLCQKYFPQSTLSVGWTTSYKGINGSYSWYNMKDMAESLQCSKVNQLVTFPVRAVFVRTSLSQLIWLLDVFPNSTLTVWSAIIDPVNVDDLLTLRSFIAYSRVYYDLPDELNKRFQERKDTIQPVVRLPGFSNHKFTIFGDDETCINKAYTTISAIMFTGQQQGIIFNKIFNSKITVEISGNVHFLTDSSLSEISLQLFISKASAFPLDHTSSGYISIPSGFDVLETLKSSAMFAHRFTNDLNNQQFELYFSSNSGTINIMHKSVEKLVSITLNFNYAEDAVVSFVSEGGSTVVYNGKFVTNDVSLASTIKANLLSLFAFFLFFHLLKM